MDVDFVSCPTFHWLEFADHRLMMDGLHLAGRNTGDTGLLEVAGKGNSADVTGGGYQE